MLSKSRIISEFQANKNHTRDLVCGRGESVPFLNTKLFAVSCFPPPILSFSLLLAPSISLFVFISFSFFLPLSTSYNHHRRHRCRRCRRQSHRIAEVMALAAQVADEAKAARIQASVVRLASGTVHMRTILTVYRAVPCCSEWGGCHTATGERYCAHAYYPNCLSCCAVPWRVVAWRAAAVAIQRLANGTAHMRSIVNVYRTVLCRAVASGAVIIQQLASGKMHT